MAIEKTLSFDSIFGDAFNDVTDAFIYIKAGHIFRDDNGDLRITVRGSGGRVRGQGGEGCWLTASRLTQVLSGSSIRMADHP